VPDSAEAIACVGYAQHRLGDDDKAIGSLRRSLQLDSEHAEARIYLANILYDQGEYEAALYHFERTSPDDHWDELGIWRLIELKRSLYRLEEGDPEIKPWDERLSELAGDLDDIDAMLMELDPRSGADTAPAAEARGQLELFGSLLSSLAEQKVEPEHHHIIESEGAQYDGSWEEIVRRLRDQTGNPADTVEEFMTGVSQHGFGQTGIRIPTHDAESFIRGSAVAGLLRIVR
jgi:tetratricopeptide (TPR) repeat protein